MRCLPSQPALKEGHGPSPSTQRVPPRTLKQWVEMQRNRDGEESILKASSRKKIPHCLESRSVVPSVLATAIQAVVSRLMAAGARTSPAQFCGKGLSTIPALLLAAQLPSLSTHFFSACRSVSVVCSYQTREAEISDHRCLHSPQTLADH